MARTSSPLVDVTPSVSRAEQAEAARMLIQANELYKVFNSHEAEATEKEQALNEAYSLATQSLEVLEGNCSALNLVARLEIEQHRFEQAESLLDIALARYPEHENTLLNYAYLLMAKRQYQRAEQTFREVLRINASSERAFSGIALAKLRQRDFLTAFNHYRRLLELGASSPTLRHYFLDSAEFLSCDYYQPEMETLLIEVFAWQGVDHAKMSNLSASLLTHKYQLHDPNAVIDMQALEQDPLLVASISHCLHVSRPLENLITELRKAILTEVILTGSLRDECLPLAIAIGRYSARNDYVMMVNRDEETQVAMIINAISQTIQIPLDIETIAGALIVLTMYEPLYTQAFSYQLLSRDVKDWPLALQELVSETLYELSDEHLEKYSLFGAPEEHLLSNEIKRASERWTLLPQLASTNIRTALCNELDETTIPERFATETVRILLVGCGSGKRAMNIAANFKQVDVVAIDDSEDNIAYASMMAKRFGVSVKFLHTALDEGTAKELRLKFGGNFDIIEFGESLNHAISPALRLETWQQCLNEDGLIRLNLHSYKYHETQGVIAQLVRARRLSPTLDNIRQLRHAISQEEDTALWNTIFEEPRFYSGTGCREMFFNAHNHYFNLEGVYQTLTKLNLEFIGFVDLPDKAKTQGNTLVPFSLMAWHELDAAQGLFDQSYQLYCKKRGS